MSEPNPGAGRRGGDPGLTFEPADESAASVFGEPARRWYPDRRPPQSAPVRQGRPAYPAPPAGPPACPDGDRPRRQSAYGQPDTQVYRRQPGRPARESGSGLPVGVGALVGVTGLACFLAALVVMPWFTEDGRDVTVSDMRSAFTIAETDPDDVLPGTTEQSPPDMSDGIPSPEQVGDAVEQQARTAAAEAAASAIDAGRSSYLELYTDVLWMILAGGVTLAVVLSTILSPRSFAASMLLGVRRMSGAVTVLAGVVHGAALWVVFTGVGAPEPAPGVWLGLAGLGAVLVGCIVGPKS